MGEPTPEGAAPAIRRSVRVSSRSGRVEVIAEPRDDVQAEKAGRRLRVEQGEQPTISSRSSALVVRVPEGSDVVVGTASGRVALRGRFGKVAVTTISGRIEIDSAEQVDARTVTSRVEVRTCTGPVTIDTVSGRANVGTAGSASLSTVSGRISVGSVAGQVGVRSISGRVSVRVSSTSPDVNVTTVSGRIEVVLAAGSSPAQSLSSGFGRVRSSVPEGGEGQVTALARSGSIDITRDG